MAVTDDFDAHARAYDGERRRLIPPYEAFYDAAVAALALAQRPVRRVLDLGAGTGLLARRIGEARDGVELTLLDAAPAMLDQARAVLGNDAAYVVGDLTGPVPAGPWDAVVSALAIHHLDDADKAAIFARVHDALRPGGVFVNAEQVAGPTPRFARLYAEWHERRSRELGATAEQWAGALERMRHDRWATVDQQLAWLHAAGFRDADCLFKDHRFAVLVARRDAPRDP